MRPAHADIIRKGCFVLFLFLLARVFTIHQHALTQLELAKDYNEDGPSRTSPALVLSSPRPLLSVHEHTSSSSSSQEAALTFLPQLLALNKTFTGECRSSLLYNDTWGQLVAPFVDKLAVKDMIKRWNTSVRIVPTLAVFNVHNISKIIPLYLAEEEQQQQQASRRRPSSFIIKPTHTSGRIARVENGTYHCFKACKKNQKRQPLSNPKTGYAAMKSFMHQLRSPYKLAYKERQYDYIPRYILVEQHLPSAIMKEYNWWVTNGQILFVCIRCEKETDGRWRQSYYSTNMKRLAIVRQGTLPCRRRQKKTYNGSTITDEEEAPPPAWKSMLQIVRALAQHVPRPGVVRIDLYASSSSSSSDDKEEVVYFSEFTFTSNGCNHEFEPRLVDTLIYAVEHNLLIGTNQSRSNTDGTAVVDHTIIESIINFESTAVGSKME